MDRFAGMSRLLLWQDLWRPMRRGLALSLFLNLTALASPLFLTEVYNRVLTTGSIDTLLVLMLLCLAALAMGALLEQRRSLDFARASAGLYADLEPHVYAAAHRAALRTSQNRRNQPFEDLEAVRSFIGGPLPGAVFDLLFSPLFIIALFFVHVWVGVFALVSVGLVAGLAFLSQVLGSRSLARAFETQNAAGMLADGQLRAAEASAAMGYVGGLRTVWSEHNRQAVRTQISSSAEASSLAAAARGVRAGLQTMIVALAACLAVYGDVSPGAIIAASILLARLLAPLDQVVAGWRQAAQVKLAADRLSALLAGNDIASESTFSLPKGPLVVEGLSANGPGERPILRGIGFSVPAGKVLAVVGSAGSGKSTLLRCLLGLWPHMAGSVRLGTVPLLHVDRERIGGTIGFLPQGADLQPGTLAQNITRFGARDEGLLQRAASLSGVASFAPSLPKGFDTDIGDSGQVLSAGQRRRAALARAYYGDPVLLCLDEPEAHMDSEGLARLDRALHELRSAGTTIVMATHRQSLLASADFVLVLGDGRVREFGPPATVFPNLAAPAAVVTRAAHPPSKPENQVMVKVAG